MPDESTIALASTMLLRVAVAAHLTQRREFDSDLVNRALDGFPEAHALWHSLLTDPLGVPLVLTLELGDETMPSKFQFKRERLGSELRKRDPIARKDPGMRAATGRTPPSPSSSLLYPSLPTHCHPQAALSPPITPRPARPELPRGVDSGRHHHGECDRPVVLDLVSRRVEDSR